jgi:hypothetical protein
MTTSCADGAESLKRSTGRVPGAALESLTLQPDEQKNDHDDQRCQAEYHQGDHGRVQDAGICLHVRISVSVVIGRQDISHIHILFMFHVIRQCDVHCDCQQDIVDNKFVKTVPKLCYSTYWACKPRCRGYQDRSKRTNRRGTDKNDCIRR